MNSRLYKKVGIELPLFVFSHCRYVVAEMMNAGGYATSPEAVERLSATVAEEAPATTRPTMTDRSGIIRGVLA